jgi:hypothetical protein
LVAGDWWLVPRVHTAALGSEWRWPGYRGLDQAGHRVEGYLLPAYDLYSRDSPALGVRGSPTLPRQEMKPDLDFSSREFREPPDRGERQ